MQFGVRMIPPRSVGLESVLLLHRSFIGMVQRVCELAFSCCLVLFSSSDSTMHDVHEKSSFFVVEEGYLLGLCLIFDKCPLQSLRKCFNTTTQTFPLRTYEFFNSSNLSFKISHSAVPSHVSLAFPITPLIALLAFIRHPFSISPLPSAFSCGP